MALSPRGKVTEASEFKYLLAVARPSSRLNDRLWRVMDAQPELHGPVLRYFQRYRIILVIRIKMRRLRELPLSLGEVVPFQRPRPREIRGLGSLVFFARLRRHRLRRTLLRHRARA